VFCILQVNDKLQRTVASQYLSTGLQGLPKVHNVVLENVEKVREKVRKVKARQAGGKMGSAMLGPFTIINIEGKGYGPSFR